MKVRGMGVELDDSLLCVDLAGVCFVSAPISLPGQVEGRLRVAVSKESVLVVQTSKKVRAAYGDRYVLLVAIVVAKHQLNIGPHTLTGVVFLGDELAVVDGPGGVDRKIASRP